MLEQRCHLWNLRKPWAKFPIVTTSNALPPFISTCLHLHHYSKFYLWQENKLLVRWSSILGDSECEVLPPKPRWYYVQRRSSWKTCNFVAIKHKFSQSLSFKEFLIRDHHNNNLIAIICWRVGLQAIAFQRFFLCFCPNGLPVYPTGTSLELKCICRPTFLICLLCTSCFRNLHYPLRWKIPQNYFEKKEITL